jgi:cyclopropane fatty-acyl-phospholipid synthase-like methyltransferase
MAVQRDPEGRETRLLFDLVGDFSGKRVLEIGSGEGRLTWHYIEEAAHVTGIDPDPDRIATAIEDTPPEMNRRVSFFTAGIDDFITPERFDLAILSWSL